MSSIRAEALTYSEMEAIVRAVLQRLRDAPSARSEHGGPTGSDSLANKIVEPQGRTALRLEQPLVTLEHLRDRWNGLSVLQVPARCVLTPAVVDEMRLRGVTLERFAATASTNSTSPETTNGKLLVLATKGNQSGLAERLVQHHVKLRWLEQDSDEAGLAEVRRHVATADQFCLWCASRPFAAMKACCRDARVSAVQLSQIEDLAQAMDEARPNVIVVDATRWRPVAIAQLTNSWMRSFA